jgi:phage terminase large subunit
LSTLKIPTAKAFEPLLKPARYKGVYGGRGSGKSHFFGELLVETCQAERSTLAVCIREAQRTLAQSSKRLIESKIDALGLDQGFRVFTDKIETPGDGVIIFRGMQGKMRMSPTRSQTFIVLRSLTRRPFRTSIRATGGWLIQIAPRLPLLV